MIRAWILLLALALAGCRDGALDRLAAGEAGRVAEVTSGDSLTLDSGLEVRLAGVEAPKGERPYADPARTALAKLVDGRTVQLLYGGVRRDRYGRALAHVRLKHGGAWVEKALLRDGAVRERTWADNRALAAPMLEAEAYARNRKLGLWALPAYQVLLPREAAYADGFQIVEGRVRRVEDADLLFDAGLTARTDEKAVPDFKTVARAPEQLRGRLVRIRGPIRDGVLKLDHPEQIELLKEKD